MLVLSLGLGDGGGMLPPGLLPFVVVALSDGLLLGLSGFGVVLEEPDSVAEVGDDLLFVLLVEGGEDVQLLEADVLHLEVPLELPQHLLCTVYAVWLLVVSVQQDPRSAVVQPDELLECGPVEGLLLGL